ncbi:MAG: hypothetical protein N3F03_06660 [Ignavibacteria bacterium]|nr:hypothetical protein [Ignavibacteria bacterium]
MTKKIFIYSDKIKSGKTTNIFRWLINKKNVSGILQPVIDGRRYFYSIHDRNLFQLEISTEQASNLNENELIKIGRYLFLKSAFEKAKEILIRDFNQNYDWIVIDEIGLLELNNSGLEPAVKNIFKEKENFKGKILCVVRDTLLNNVVQHYQIENDYELIDIGNL